MRSLKVLVFAAAASLLFVPLVIAGTLSSALPSAAEQEDVRRVKHLLAQSINPDTIDSNGWTALMWATRWTNWPLVQLAVVKGADVNFRDEDGDTPLINAVLHATHLSADLRIIRLLLDRGADPTIRNRKGYSALSIATGEEPPQHGQPKVVRLLRRYMDKHR